MASLPSTLRWCRQGEWRCLGRWTQRLIAASPDLALSGRQLSAPSLCHLAAGTMLWWFA